MSSRAEVDGPRVVIVGAGVSGCACAGVLATAGVEVLLVSASLDAAGMPAYGPVVPAAGAPGGARLLAAVGGLPHDRRCGWWGPGNPGRWPGLFCGVWRSAARSEMRLVG